MAIDIKGAAAVVANQLFRESEDGKIDGLFSIAPGLKELLGDIQRELGTTVSSTALQWDKFEIQPHNSVDVGSAGKTTLRIQEQKLNSSGAPLKEGETYVSSVLHIRLIDRKPNQGAPIIVGPNTDLHDVAVQLLRYAVDGEAIRIEPAKLVGSGPDTKQAFQARS